jgi:putative chitinase
MTSLSTLPQALTAETLVQIGGPVPAKSRARRLANCTLLAAELPPLMDLFEIDRPLRMAHFLSQLAHESDSFCTFEEYASGEAYEGRRDLGNVKAGDGKRFKGLGPIQLTGRANYRAFTAWMRKQLGDDAPDFEANPHLVKDDAFVAWSAVYFWDEKRLNQIADRDDVVAVTRVINGGRNGLDDRKAKLARAKAEVAGLSAKATKTPFSRQWPVLHRGMFNDDDVERLQTILARRGYLIGIDGDFGPATELAVKSFQVLKSLPSSGVVDPATWAALTGD